MRCYILFLILQASSSASAAELVTGTLCLQQESARALLFPSESCAAVAGLRWEIVPDEERRRFLWLSEDGRQAAIGLVEPGEGTIDLATELDTEVLLGIQGNPERGWPLAGKVRLVQPDLEWQWIAPPEMISRWSTLLMPAGEYELRLSVPHHRELRSGAAEITSGRHELGTITLSPLPRLRGRVINSSDTPLPGAEVLTSENEVIAISDPLGEIEVELDDEMPEEITLRAAGLAPRTIPIDTRGSDFDFGTVRLTAGGSLRLLFERDGELSDVPLTLRLMREARDPDDRKEIVSRTIESNEEELLLESLEPLEYHLLAAGPGPLEKIARHVTVEEGRETEERVTIRPLSVELMVRRGSQPLPGVMLEIEAPAVPGPPWSATVVTGDDGTTRQQVWQPGSYLAKLSEDGSSQWFSIDSKQRQKIEISFPDARIAGRVYDEKTGQPIPGTAVVLRQQESGTSSVVTLFSDEEGRFERTGAAAGAYEAEVRNPRYVAWKGQFVLTEGEREKVLDIALVKGNQRAVRVTMEGRPVAGAIVRRIGPGGGRWTTDARGLATVPLHDGQVAGLWVISPDGSFAFRELEGDQEILDIPLQPAGGRLEITVVDSDGQPLNDVELFFSQDGRTVPLAIREEIARAQGSQFRTGPTGVLGPNLPPGSYDFWGVHDPFRVAVSPPAGQSAVRAFVTAGQQTIALEVERTED